jgi:hypothetical protein
MPFISRLHKLNRKLKRRKCFATDFMKPRLSEQQNQAKTLQEKSSDQYPSRTQMENA